MLDNPTLARSLNDIDAYLQVLAVQHRLLEEYRAAVLVDADPKKLLLLHQRLEDQDKRIYQGNSSEPAMRAALDIAVGALNLPARFASQVPYGRVTARDLAYLYTEFFAEYLDWPAVAANPVPEADAARLLIAGATPGMSPGHGSSDYGEHAERLAAVIPDLPGGYEQTCAKVLRALLAAMAARVNPVASHERQREAIAEFVAAVLAGILTYVRDRRVVAEVVVEMERYLVSLRSEP